MAAEDQHIWDLMAYLDDLDGKEIEVVFTADPVKSKAAFDRQVRESIERQHRRQVIAGS